MGRFMFSAALALAVALMCRVSVADEVEDLRAQVVTARETLAAANQAFRDAKGPAVPAAARARQAAYLALQEAEARVREAEARAKDDARKKAFIESERALCSKSRARREAGRIYRAWELQHCKTVDNTRYVWTTFRDSRGYLVQKQVREGALDVVCDKTKPPPKPPAGGELRGPAFTDEVLNERCRTYDAEEASSSDAGAPAISTIDASLDAH